MIALLNDKPGCRNLSPRKFIVLLLTLLPSLLFAQENKKAPTGKEIASLVKNYRLLHQLKKTELINGKKISITPTEIIDSTKSEKEGIFLGVLENEIAGDETGLPPGRYNLFFAYVDKKPHIYAESNGGIVKEALRVSVEKLKEKPHPKDQIVIKSKGWTTYIYFYRIGNLGGTYPPSDSGIGCIYCNGMYGGSW